MIINVLIVEDELIHAWNIEQMLIELGNYKVLSVFQDSETALKYIENRKTAIDVILLDIHLKGNMNGIELAKKINKYSVPVIFITQNSSEQYYREAECISKFSFLVKPFYKFTLESVIRLLLPSLSASKTPIYIKVGDRREIIDPKNICWIESNRNYSTIYTSNNHFAVKRSLKTLSSSLPTELFIPIHKSFLVQLSLIKRINIKEQTILVNDSILPLGRTYIKSLRQHLVHLG